MTTIAQTSNNQALYQIKSLLKESDSTQNKQLKLQTAFDLIAEQMKTLQISIKESHKLPLSIRCSYPHQHYPASAYLSAIYGVANPYFIVWGLKIPQTSELTSCSKALIAQVETLKNSESLPENYFTEFDNRWSAFETRYFQDLKETFETAKQRYQKLGTLEIPDFISKLSQKFPLRALNYLNYQKASQLPISHEPLAKECLEKVEKLQTWFKNPTDPFSKDFPAPLVESLQACEMSFAHFETLTTDTFWLKYLESLIEVLTLHKKEIMPDCLDDKSMILFPRIGVYYLWKKSTEQEINLFFIEAPVSLNPEIVFHLLMEENVENASPQDKNAARFFIDFSYKLHSKNGALFSSCLQLALAHC